MSIRAVLVDADGVLQRNPDGWLDEVRGFVAAADADAFTDDLWATEREAMAGRRPFADVAAEVADRWGFTGREDDLVALWRQVRVEEATVAVVRELRAAGLGVHLATNQNDVRAAYLLEGLGYAELFDHCFCSCAIGATKDDPAFFAHVLAELGLPADQVLLVDDGPSYADTARAAGLRALTWELDEGVEALRRRLADHGVSLG